MACIQTIEMNQQSWSMLCDCHETKCQEGIFHIQIVCMVVIDLYWCSAQVEMKELDEVNTKIPFILKYHLIDNPTNKLSKQSN